MIVFLLLFVGLPIALTLVFGDKDRTIAYWMPFTLLILFVIWTVIALPLSLMGTKFHVPLYIFIGVLVVFVCFVIFMLIKRRKEVKKKIKKYFSGDFKKHFTNVCFIVMLVLILFQAGRVTIFEPSEHRDSKSYTSIANDIIENDSFNEIDDLTGAEVSDPSAITKKFRLSTWYSFEAVLSVLTYKKPLLLNNTMLPGYLIMITYMIWWCISDKLFKSDTKIRSLFMIALIMLYEFVGDDITIIFLMWPTWGKNITAMIIAPFFIYEWIRFTKEDVKKNTNTIQLFFLMLAGCAASNMGFMIMPVELTFMAIAEMIERKRIGIKMLLNYIVLLIPVAIYAALYFLLK